MTNTLLTSIGTKLVSRSLPKPSLRILVPSILHASEGLSSRAIAQEISAGGMHVSHTTIAKTIKRFKRDYESNKTFWHLLERILILAEPISLRTGLSIADVLGMGASQAYTQKKASLLADHTEDSGALLKKEFVRFEREWGMVNPKTQHDILNGTWTAIIGTEK